MTIVNMLGLVGSVQADALSIYEIQYTEDPNGNSPLDGQLVNCSGGIVIHKYARGFKRIYLYNDAYYDGWGGIVVKDLTADANLFNDVNIGDWLSLTNVGVTEEDYKARGNTQLIFDFALGSAFEIDPAKSKGPDYNPIPTVVSPADIAAPLYDPERNGWFVANRSAEKYEGMLIKVINVNVQDTGYGKAYDNYILESNVDPNLACWASDYMNDDATEIYHPYVEIGQNFCGVAGVLEQYDGLKEGIDYDYYQLLTTSTEDFTIYQTADFDGDCDVDFLDFSVFAQHWLEDGCTGPDWCGGADLIHDANEIVDMFDLMEFSQYWLESKY